jgi:sphingolipid 8-(E)-desaturase
LDDATQQHIIDEFRELHIRLREEGYFNCNYWGYVREAMRIGTLLTLSYILFGWRDSSIVWLTLSAIALGLAWHQLTFIAHDAGHLGITHDYQVDSVIGVLLADFVGGLSIGWWKRNHNVHHFVTNDPEHDPDIQHLPFFAVSVKFLKNITSSFYDRVLEFDAFAKRLIPMQNYTYFVILALGRINLYRLSWEYLLRGQGPRKGKGAWLRYLELTGLATFFYWFFYVVVTCSLKTAGERWLYVIVTHVVTMPVHVQIPLSHFAMSTSDLGLDESFPQRQIRTTMDVDCPWWLDYLHGGLQFQVIHHLFPRMPRHNLRAVQPKIIEFADKLGLHYTIYGFTRGNKEVLGKLGEIAKQAKILLESNEYCKAELLGDVSLSDKKAI